MAWEIALVGGDEFRQGCEEMDRQIMRASGQDPARVLIVPTAAVGAPERAAANGIRHFSGLGGDAQPLMALERGHSNDPRIAEAVSGCGVVYLTGGSPDHLLATLRDSLLLEAMRVAAERGAVLAGSSAGAMVMGSLMRRPQQGKWVEALGLTPGIAVLPHHENRDPAQTSRELQGQVPSDLVVLGIDGRTGCLGTPGKRRVVGAGKVTVFRGGGWQVYQSGEALPPEI